MIRKFCDFCNAEIDGSNPAAVYDESLVFEGKQVVLRVELRNNKQNEPAMKRPDVCFDCRNAIIARMFALKAEAT